MKDSRYDIFKIVEPVHECVYDRGLSGGTTHIPKSSVIENKVVIITECGSIGSVSDGTGDDFLVATSVKHRTRFHVNDLGDLILSDDELCVIGLTEFGITAEFIFVPVGMIGNIQCT